MDFKNHEKIVGNFYNEWSKCFQNDETLAMHCGYHKKGTKSFEESLLNMNDYVADLLHLSDKNNINILDAGCGIGGTLIYLAKKYPNVKFTGITIASDQVALATKYARDRDVSNTKFMFGNYIKTDFLDNSFDGVFALESSNYISDHNAFVNEMYRILKPDGHLAVVDGFRTPRPINFMMEKIYQQFRIEFGYVDPAIISNFEHYLKQRGFAEIKIEDISKNVRNSVFQWSILDAPTYISKMLKRTINFGRINPNEDPSSYFKGNMVLGGICGLCGVIRYYGISAVKK